MNFTEAIEIILSSYKLQIFTSAISGVTCALIGCFIILRGMALIGDALSHAILPGVVIAFMIAGTGPWGLFIGAMLAGLITSVSIGFIQQHSRVKEDSSIGIAFTFFFAIGIILASKLDKGVHFDLHCFLFGSVLGIQAADMQMMIAMGILVCLTVIILYRPLLVSTFDPIMAACMGINVAFIHYLMMAVLSAAVVASLQTVGVIMVVAMLITPGATAYQLTDRLPVMLILAVLIGGFSSMAGFVFAFWLNWPPGPSMTVFAGALFFLAMLFSPRYGTVFIRYRRLRTSRHILEEDIVKSVVRNYPDPLAYESLQEHLGVDKARLGKAIKRLYKNDMLSFQGDHLSLTDHGKALADEILRSHRLWERYLVEGGMPAELVHSVAEALEHAHEMADSLDEKLGAPLTDPHGQKIPKRLSGK